MTDRIRSLAAAALSRKPGEPMPLVSGCDLLAGDGSIELAMPQYKPAYSLPDTPDAAEKYRNLQNRLWIGAGNHMSADYEYVLRYGLEGLLRKIGQSAEAHRADSEKCAFLQALRELCLSIAGRTAGISAHCRALADAEPGPARKAELQTLAVICERVPMLPCRTFYEATQCFYFIFLLFPDGVGRLDQYLYPFFEADRKSGRITEAFAYELIQALFIRIFERLGPGELWSGNNHMVVSGYRSDGEDGYNALTPLIIKAIEELPTWRPQVSFRWTDKTTFTQLRQAVAANRNRFDLIMFLNDEVILRGLDKLAVPRHDAANYSMSGCNELILTGQSQMGSVEGHVNMLASLERVLSMPDALSSARTFDDFYDLYSAALRDDIGIILELSESRDRRARADAMLLPSLFTEGCAENGLPITWGGAKYNFCTWCAIGLVNLADSLSVVKQFVYEEKQFSLPELANMLRDDWAGREDARVEILKRGRFFGNDDDGADSLLRRVIDTLNSTVEGRTPVRGGRYTFGTLSGYELAHMVFGRATGATPDGRHAGEELVATVAAGPGKDRNGITAYLKSAAKIDYAKLPSAVTVSLKLDKNVADSDEKLDMLTRLIETYFQLGGVQLQINYIDADELVRAQNCPEDYKNLRVRVTGFSGFFTSFDRDLQDEIIARTTHRS